MNIQELIIPAIGETLYMVFLGAFFAVLLGLPVGLLLFVTQKEGIAEKRGVYRVFDVIVNIMRSVPYSIMMVLLIPLSEFLLGTSIGPTATVISLSLSAAPFFARMLESSLNEVDKGVIEAAKSMGSSNKQLVFRVLIPEAMPSIIGAVTTMVINLIGYTAMAGMLGAGGLGAVAIRYGLYRREPKIMYLTVVLIVVLVQLIQLAGNRLAQRVSKK